MIETNEIGNKYKKNMISLIFIFVSSILREKEKLKY